jgi:hypothetical protein
MISPLALWWGLYQPEQGGKAQNATCQNSGSSYSLAPSIISPVIAP